MVKLVCCDMDGTLVDTDMAVFLAYKKALEDYNISFSYDYYIKECKGKSYKQFLPVLLSSIDDIEKVHDIKKACYKDFVKNTAVNYALVDTLKMYKSQGIHIVLVTTATAKNCKDVLLSHNLETLFDHLITQEDVQRPKPHPEGYLKAMNKFNVRPEETIIFEDSDIGLEAALKSGASVFAVKQF